MSTSFAGLCSVCRGIFDDPPHSITNPEDRPIDHTKATFIASVRDGCRFCNAICRSLFGWIYANANGTTTRDPATAGIPDDFRLRCSFSAVSRNPEENSGVRGHIAMLSNELVKGYPESINLVLEDYDLGLRMNVWNEEEPDQKFSMVVRPFMPGSQEALMQEHLQDQKTTATNQNFKLISRWLSNCRDTHDCGSWSERNKATPDWMPTRLVKVVAAGPETTTYHLVETKELTEPVKYLTLSHCWGTWRHAAMKMEDLEPFKERIPPAILTSQTFLEAFAITRRLGFKYIWIDSLCIVQGDTADWAKESARMSEVYGHAHMNLIAAHARDGREGCFHDRNVLTVRPCKIPNPFNLSSDDYFLVYPMRIDKIFEEEVRSSPAYKRAWILQERLLAARTLYFGRNQLFWACGKLEACEAFPSGANYGSARPHNQNPVDKQGLQLLLNRAVTAMHNKTQLISESWARIVKMYTAANMTEPSDKLIALQGIAARVQEHIGGRYYAGLWHTKDDDLLWSLLWFVDSSDKKRTRPSGYRAPSWSWASVDGQIEMSTPDPSWKHRISRPTLKVSYDLVVPSKVKISQINTEKADPLSAPYGAVTNGKLVIQCSLKKARMKKIGKEDTFAYEFFDAVLYGDENGRDSTPLCYCHLDVPSEFFETQENPEADIVTCLPLIREKEKKQGGFTGSFREHGLLLRPAPGRAAKPTSFRPEYQRIGHFTSLIRRGFDWLEESSSQDIITII